MGACAARVLVSLPFGLTHAPPFLQPARPPAGSVWQRAPPPGLHAHVQYMLWCGHNPVLASACACNGGCAAPPPPRAPSALSMRTIETTHNITTNRTHPPELQPCRRRRRQERVHRPLRVLCGTWNVGNAAPPDDLSSWLTGVDKLEHDLVAIGVQVGGWRLAVGGSHLSGCLVCWLVVGWLTVRHVWPSQRMAIAFCCKSLDSWEGHSKAGQVRAPRGACRP